jgi:hypothetical protein
MISRASCLALSESFFMVPRASGLVFMFCAPRLIFGGTMGIESRFHTLCSRTRFRWYCRRRVLFSCFALSDSFFGGAEGSKVDFHVLRSQTHFRQYQGR